MPLYLALSLLHDINLQIWKVTEDIDFFSVDQEWYEREASWINSIHPKKRMDYLASRYILYKHLNPVQKLPIIKDEFGKLKFDREDQFLSISHSGNYSSFVIGPKELGLDIQIYDSKILRILPKFLSASELELVQSIDDLDRRLRIGILCWTAKEAIYKAHGKRGIQFNEQIKINFDLLELTGGSLSLQEQTIDYKFTYGMEEEFAWLVAHHDEYNDDIRSEFM